MIRRGTWFVLLLLLALVGFSLYLRDRQADGAAETKPTESMAHLFESTLGSPTLIRVENSAGEKVEFSRDSAGTWVLNAPTAQADQAAAEAAATQVGDLRILSTVDLPPDVIGLEKPEFTITLGFGELETHRLQIGSVTPVNDGFYSQLDSGPFQIVDKHGLDKLVGLLAAPPYLETLTPSPTATAPASATPSAGPETPTPAASPSLEVEAQPAAATGTP